MPAQYFVIPFANHPALVELQDFLRTKLPPGANWQDPARFHLTLVFAEETGSANLAGVAWPKSLPLFGLGGEYIDSLKTPEGTAIVLDVQKSPQLIYLQSALFYEARSAGATLSSFSWPGLWRPHITLATLPPEAEMYASSPVQMHLQVDRFTLSGDEYTEVASFALQVAGPGGAPVQEMATLNDVLVVGEFKGAPPDVPLISGINLAELTAGDSDPMFVTLPVAEVDAASANGRYYDAEFVRVLQEQTREKRPGGLRGHLRDEERDSAFPLPEAHWVGVKQVGDTLWAKAYVPPGEFREYVRRLKSTGAKLATSIYGTAEMEWMPERGLWRVVPETFELESIDFAPPERAGVKSLAVVPHITAEMAGQEGDTMDKNQVIRELTVDDAVLLPDVVRAAVVDGSAPARLVAEMRKALSLDDKGDVIAAVSGLVKQVAEMTASAVDAAVAAEVASAIKVEDARGIVAELVRARKPATVEAVKGIVAEIADSEHVKALLVKLVGETMGEPQRRNAGTPGGDGQGIEQFVVIPKEADAAK